MYQMHFHLQGQPFAAASNPDHYFPAAAIEKARETLVMSIQRAAGAGVVIGPVGAGKTLLCQLMADHFAEELPVCMLSGARLCTRQTLLQAMLHRLGLSFRNQDEGEMRLTLMDHIAGPACPHGILLIVDEADGLPLELLEEIRVVTNVVHHGEPRVRLLLAGGPRLEERIGHPRLESLNQRIVSRLYLQTFTAEETADYVRTRITASGGVASNTFNDEALEMVYRATSGVPRLVNQLCDHALILAAVGGQEMLDGAGIEEAWADLQQLPLPARVTLPPEASSGAVVEFGPLDDETDMVDVVTPTFDDEESPEATSRDELLGADHNFVLAAEEADAEAADADEELDSVFDPTAHLEDIQRQFDSIDGDEPRDAEVTVVVDQDSSWDDAEEEETTEALIEAAADSADDSGDCLLEATSQSPESEHHEGQPLDDGGGDDQLSGSDDFRGQHQETQRAETPHQEVRYDDHAYDERRQLERQHEERQHEEEEDEDYVLAAELDSPGAAAALEFPSLELTMERATNPFEEEFQEEEVVIRQFASPAEIARRGERQVASAYSRDLAGRLTAAHPGFRMHVADVDPRHEDEEAYLEAGFQPLSHYLQQMSEDDVALTSDQSVDERESQPEIESTATEESATEDVEAADHVERDETISESLLPPDAYDDVGETAIEATDGELDELPPRHGFDPASDPLLPEHTEAAFMIEPPVEPHDEVIEEAEETEETEEAEPATFLHVVDGGSPAAESPADPDAADATHAPISIFAPTDAVEHVELANEMEPKEGREPDEVEESTYKFLPSENVAKQGAVFVDHSEPELAFETGDGDAEDTSPPSAAATRHSSAEASRGKPKPKVFRSLFSSLRQRTS